MVANELISRLDKVKRTGTDRWTARCPAHDDRGPSLAIREMEDGRVLLKCFAGCEAHEVVQALGMELSDLFPLRPTSANPDRRPFPTADILRCIGFEVLIVSVVASTLAAGKALSALDHDRLMLAINRIQAAITMGGLTDA
jgi:hypothetical protein